MVTYHILDFIAAFGLNVLPPPGMVCSKKVDEFAFFKISHEFSTSKLLLTNFLKNIIAWLLLYIPTMQYPEEVKDSWNVHDKVILFPTHCTSILCSRYNIFSMTLTLKCL